MKLYLLSGGLIDVDRAVIHPGDDSHRRVVLPCMQVLIQSEGQTVLVDTGMPLHAVGDPEGLQRAYGMEAGWIRPLMHADERLRAQLGFLDLALSDLDLVINTHFHFDHAGQNAQCAGIPIAAQEAELLAARDDDYLPVWDGPGVQFRSVQGDWSPLPGVEMLFTPGHSPGHQSMMVRSLDPPWLFTWDAVYTEEHWRTQKLGAVRDVSSARASVERLRSIAEAENARVIFGHDAAQWGALGMGEARRPRLIAST